MTRRSNVERSPWREALTPWAATRLAVLLVTMLAAILLPSSPDRSWYLSAAEPRNPFAVWDSTWYREIALIGYPEGEGVADPFAFFPLYPMIVRGVRALGAHVWEAAVLVSNVSFYLALVGLWALTRRLHGTAAARRTVLYLAAFPFSFYFSHGYAESLFLMLTVATFLFAEQRRWSACAVTGAAAALTRPFGVLMVLPAAVWALRALPRRDAGGKPDDDSPAIAHVVAGTPETKPPAREVAGPLVAVVAPLLGIGAYSLFCALRTGDPLAWLHAHQSWGYELGTSPLLGYTTFFEKVYNFGLYGSLTSYPYSIYEFIGAMIAAAFVLFTILVASRLGAAYFVWSLAMLAVPLGSGSWEALGRYCSLNFPVFMALATLENRTLDIIMTVAAAVLLGLLAALFVSHPLT
jgi:hypothetical protein